MPRRKKRHLSRDTAPVCRGFVPTRLNSDSRQSRNNLRRQLMRASKPCIAPIVSCLFSVGEHRKRGRKRDIPYTRSRAHTWDKKKRASNRARRREKEWKDEKEGEGEYDGVWYRRRGDLSRKDERETIGVEKGAVREGEREGRKRERERERERERKREKGARPREKRGEPRHRAD